MEKACVQRSDLINNTHSQFHHLCRYQFHSSEASNAERGDDVEVIKGSGGRETRHHVLQLDEPRRQRLALVPGDGLPA